MKYFVEYQDEANDDLLLYVDYIERNTFSLETAESLAAEIFSETVKLTYFPYMYPKTYKDFHTFNVNNRKVFYKIYEEQKKVVIFRILSGFQDYKNYL